MAGAQVTLVSPFPHVVYSGMVPGWIAGHYALEECLIPLVPLAERAGVAFHQSAAVDVDPDRRIVRCADGVEHPYDLLSINTGMMTEIQRLSPSAEHGLAVRPLEAFVERWTALSKHLRSSDGRIVIIGGGAAGVELALAMRYSLRDRPGTGFTLVSATNTLPGNSSAPLHRLLLAAGIEVLESKFATRVEPEAVVGLDDGSIIKASAVIVSTGGVVASWITQSGLAVDARGSLATDEALRVLSHRDVFATGDCASVRNHPRPKSGVYSLRAGPLLLTNLRRTLSGQALAARVPRTRSLHLISAGERYAVATWGGVAFEGAWVWRWKDRIDRAFIAKHASRPLRRVTALPV